MREENQLLRLRVLLCFWNDAGKSGTVTKIAGTLGTEKYTITRMLDGLEQEGLVDRTNPRKPCLTELGIWETKRYVRRMEAAANHLMYEGVEPEFAVLDSMYWALYNSEQTMQVIEAAEQRCRIKNEMQDKSRFTGAVLCRQMRDGAYRFPFLLYRENAKEGSNISVLDEGFLHPCTLVVNEGQGTVMLQRITMLKKLPNTNRESSRKIRRVSYYDGEERFDAEIRGNIVLLPAAVLKFVSVGQGVDAILHGSVRLSLESTEPMEEEATVLFTILI